MRSMYAALIALACLGVSPPSESAVDSDMIEVGFEAYYHNEQGDFGDLRQLGADFELGPYITDALQVVVLLGIFDGNQDNAAFSGRRLGAGANWHFNTDGNTVPFVGATLMKGNIDDEGFTDSKINYRDYHAGLKIFVKEDLAVRVVMVRSRTEQDFDFVGKATTDSTDIEVGFSVFF